MKTTILSNLAMMASLSLSGLPAPEYGGTRMIETVRGKVPIADLSLSLSHEHVLVDFVGAAEITPDRYDADEAYHVARPYLEQAARHGVETLFECTPAFLGRDVTLLKRLSQATGMRIVTNTGIYGAAGDKFVPSWALAASAEKIAERWIAEAQDGIDGTGIRPGFIKTGVDPEPELSAIDRKLIVAAALTHRATGLTIAAHTGSGPGLDIIEILGERGIRPEAYVWVHGQNAPMEAIEQAAEKGAWISLDGLRPSSLGKHADRLSILKEQGRLDQVLISHDAGWFDPGKLGGGEYRGYELLFTDFLPMLREHGFAETEIKGLLVDNVAEAFAVRSRLVDVRSPGNQDLAP